MVSLRERKARASYSNIAEGLADLSSDDGNSKHESSDAGSPSRARAESDLQDQDVKNDHNEDDEDGDSISSGDSSEFRPDSASPDKSKGKGKEKANSDDDDDDDEEMINDLVDEDEDGGFVEVDDDDIDPILRSGSNRPTPDLSRIGGNKKKSRIRQSGTGTALPRASMTGSSASYSTYGQSAVNHLPVSYRKLIKEATVAITKPTPGLRGIDNVAETRKERDRDSTRVHGLEAIPAGHVIPFSSRLKERPDRRNGGNVEWTDESKDVNGGLEKRRERNRNKSWKDVNEMTLLSPWEKWRGEGWWPEMYVGPEGQSSGKKKDWLLRDQVKLGLDDVGRTSQKQLVILSDTDAEPYLPTPINKDGDPWMTCHMGPHDDQRPRNFQIFQSSTLATTNPVVPHEGYTFFAGGPIWGMDWCPHPETIPGKSTNTDDRQYLAVSTLPHIDTRPAMGEKWPRESKGCIQIWSLSPAGCQSPTPIDIDDIDEDVPMPPRGEMRCEIVLCIQGGPAMEIKWMPLGAWDKHDPRQTGPESDLPKLGILTAVQVDGSISFYAVPHPRSLVSVGSTHPLFLQLHEPLLRLEIPDTSCMCFDWINGTRIAVGLANGHLAIWDILDALKSNSNSDLLPSVYTALSPSAIRSLAVGHVPPAETDLNGNPIFIVAGSYDGTLIMLDLRDPAFPIEMNRMRIPSMTVGWAAQMASPLHCDIDYVVCAIKIRKSGAGRHHPIASHRGQVWSIATSDYHTMLLTAGADGALIISDYHSGFFRKRKTPLVFQRLYEMDYDKHTGEYRLLDDFLPENLPLEAASARRPPSVAKRQSGQGDPNTNILNTATWSPHIGIHKVVWNDCSGLGRAGWMASGMASGLARVEWIEGSWKKGEFRA